MHHSASMSGSLQKVITAMSHEHRSILNHKKLLFLQELVLGQLQRNVRARHNWPLVRGISYWLVDSLHKGPVMRKAFLCFDIIWNIEAFFFLLSLLNNLEFSKIIEFEKIFFTVREKFGNLFKSWKSPVQNITKFISLIIVQIVTITYAELGALMKWILLWAVWELI